MLTRLKVKGFKNLVDVDIRFGPFTCIAGANAVGKSNLFDAIQFLSMLAQGNLLMEAAKAVRDNKDKTGSVKSIFNKTGDKFGNRIEFEVEMIIPSEVKDDLGQTAKATTTFLSYKLKLKRKKDEKAITPVETIEIVEEELDRIKISEATKHLLFHHKPIWRKSVIKGKRGSAFISTQQKRGTTLLRLHQDGSKGKPWDMPATALKRTLLSTVNGAERPTAFIARKEMQSWRLLRLEPSALRKPDEFTAPTIIGIDGSHLPSTLFHLSQHKNEDVYGSIANRLATLVDDVYSISVDVDKARDLFTLQVRNRKKTLFDARSLSDGTLRFLALAVLEANPDEKGLICLEEPENGIHPGRMRAMIDLLISITTDTNEIVDSGNPLRQIIINTHSPVIVKEVPDDSLLLAVLEETIYNNERTEGVCFRCLPKTWRDKKAKVESISMGKLLTYLNPSIPKNKEELAKSGSKSRRVIDNPELRKLQIYFPFMAYKR
ncbi:MAG: AAA family ATPase [Bacteroidales bacterium]|nr:AAA family ATPase [Bacteroidales bacterium]